MTLGARWTYPQLWLAIRSLEDIGRIRGEAYTQNASGVSHDSGTPQVTETTRDGVTIQRTTMTMEQLMRMKGHVE